MFAIFQLKANKFTLMQINEDECRRLKTIKKKNYGVDTAFVNTLKHCVKLFIYMSYHLPFLQGEYFDKQLQKCSTQ